MSGASTVPSALAALQVTIAAALPNVQVFGGQPLNNLEDDFVAVGWDEQGPAVLLRQVALTRGFGIQKESYDIQSLITSWRGDPGAAAEVVARAFTLFDSIQAAIIAAPSLGLPSLMAQVSGVGYIPAQTSTGPQGRLQFTVSIDAAK